MRVFKNYSLKKVTTIGLGGSCRELICPLTMEDLRELVDLNPLFIGNGSNICFVTDYYDRSIVSLKYMEKKISFDKKYIYCTSNVSCTRLARYLFMNKLSGYEFLYGIPGTVGGAVYMNAGAFDDEILQHVHSVDLIDNNGITYTMYQDDLEYSYRKSNFDESSIIMSIKLYNKLATFDSDLLSVLNHKRKTSQPTNNLSCGCIFKNPLDDYAARLIEEANLKGLRVGGIYVSRKHSNYFINDGSGTYQDFTLLLSKVKDIISSKYNIRLEEEVLLIK